MTGDETPQPGRSGRPRLVLASASPSRRRLLAEAGIEADVVPSGVDETAVTTADPGRLCEELARRKAEAVADRLRSTAAGDPATGTAGLADPLLPTAFAAIPGHDRAAAAAGQVLVLGCDSVLAFDGESLGKPTDAAEAVARWRRMRGRDGVLHTGHAVVSLAAGRTVTAVSQARVFFARISDEEIEAYVATGEPLAVAGAFTLEGFGSPFIERIDGDPGTVMGLSPPLLRTLLARLGVPITACWSAPAPSPGPDQP